MLSLFVVFIHKPDSALMGVCQADKAVALLSKTPGRASGAGADIDDSSS